MNLAQISSSSSVSWPQATVGVTYSHRCEGRAGVTQVRDMGVGPACSCSSLVLIPNVTLASYDESVLVLPAL